MLHLIVSTIVKLITSTCNCINHLYLILQAQQDNATKKTSSDDGDDTESPSPSLGQKDVSDTDRSLPLNRHSEDCEDVIMKDTEDVIMKTAQQVTPDPKDKTAGESEYIGLLVPCVFVFIIMSFPC